MPGRHSKTLRSFSWNQGKLFRTAILLTESHISGRSAPNLGISYWHLKRYPERTYQWLCSRVLTMKTKLLALTLTLFTPLLGYTDVSYNYLEAGLIQTDLDFGFVDVDGSGFALEGSFDLTDDFFFVGNYSSADIDGVDFNNLFIGGGYHSDINQPVQFVGLLGFARSELDAGSLGDEDETGLQASIGARGEFSANAEWDVFLDYTDIDDIETSIRGEARYKFSPTLAAGLSFSTGDVVTSFGLHVRWLY